MGNRIRASWLRDPRLQSLLQTLEAHGGVARVAGGAVRNTILRKSISDIDVATTLVPEEVMKICKAAGFSVHPTGIDHGTLTIVIYSTPASSGEMLTVEVTTLRKDVETDGRRAVVAFTKDWTIDASRRDFTMNALYCDKNGNIFDFTDGYRDCLNQKIKFVGSPARRIAEDALRILRFFRFHAQYGKGALDAKGLAACVRTRKKIQRLSAERIRCEFLKILSAPGAIPVLRIMAAKGILSEILPHTDDFRTIGRLPADPLLRLAALAKEPHGLKSLLRLSNDEAQRIKWIADSPALSTKLKPSEQRRLLYQLGSETWKAAVALSFAQSREGAMSPGWRKMLKLPEANPPPQLPLTGHDLIAAGLAPGPALGQVLQGLEDWWVASDFVPTKDELLARARKQ